MQRSKTLDISLIMLGAGDSTRFELPVKKQFIRLKNEPLWLVATKNLSSFYPFKKVLIASNHSEYLKKFAPDYDYVIGGKTRSASLKNALEAINTEFVMVSDVARVCISQKLFSRLIENAYNADCVSPALRVNDTTLYEDKALQREQIKLIQTPQLSRTALLKQALAQNKEFTDDSTAMASLGAKICFVEGEEKALKITFKEDLKKLDLPAPESEFFCGNGFDVHCFGEKRPLLLGGVKVHKDKGLKAHSDGDVLTHSLIDALLGAASLGDIGELFPDTKAEFKNADSIKLLQIAYKKVQEVGFELVNADITVLAQQPKLSEFKAQIAAHLAKSLNVDEFRINVKATTTEKLGFIGREEGIGVLATVNLKYFDWTKL